ncbi:MAG: O-antigen ligase family protein [Flavobacteriales bacterium]
MTYLLIILFISAIFCNSAFGIGPNLYPLRLLLPIVLAYFSVLTFQKVVLLKKPLKIDLLLLLSLSFFAYMFFHTSVVSYLRYDFLGDSYELNSLLNYGFLITLIISLFLVVISERKQFLTLFKGVVLLFYVGYVVFAIYEIISGNHLETSNLVDSPSWMRHMPTVVFFNSNDFAAIFTLMLLYLSSVFDTKKKLPSYIVIPFLLIHLLIVYYSMSRLALILSMLFFVYRYPKYILNIIFLSIPVVILFFVSANESQLMTLYDSVIALKNDLSFSERESTSVRLYLYKYALLSPLYNYGMGFGIDSSIAYYQSIHDPNLDFIINPHSYIFELLINSGVLTTLIYIVLNAYLIIKNIMMKQYILMAQVITFNLLLFSSSSSLFLWPTYLFFIVYICRTSDNISLYKLKD